MGSSLATVLFTDIVGSTERAAELGNRRWREVLEQHHERLRREIQHCGGAEANTAGDAIVATFKRPGRAIRCACSIRDAARELGLEVRSGLHTGEIEVIDGTAGGIAVHTGARVAAQAGPGEVLVSSTLHDVVAGLGFEFEDRGIHALKGVPGEWRLFAVSDIPAADEAPRRWLGLLPIPDRQFLLPLGALTLGLIVLLAVFVLRYNLDWPAVVVAALLAGAIEMLAYVLLQRAPRRKQALRTVGYAGGVLTVAALGVGFASPSPERDDVLVVPFLQAAAAQDVETVESAEGVAGLLREQLAASAFLRPLSYLLVNDLYQDLGLGADGPQTLDQVARVYVASGADYLALVQAARPDSVVVQLFSSVDEWRPLDTVELGRVDPEGVLQAVARSADRLKGQISSPVARLEREADIGQQLGTGAAAFQDFLRGRQLYFFDDLQGARLAFEEAVRQDSTFGLAHAWLARVYDRLFDPRAVVELQAASRHAESAPGSHQDFIRANDLLIRKQYEDLGELLPGLVDEHADDPEMLLQLGEMYRLLEYVDTSKLDYAEPRFELYTRLRQVEPRNPTVHKELGRLAVQRSDWQRAEEEFERAVALNPYSADGYYNLGFLNRVLGRYDRALEAFATADSLRPGYAKDEIAFTLIELGRYGEARRLLLEGLATRGLGADQAAWTHMSLGGLALEAGDTATAMAEVENAARVLGTGTGGDEFLRQTMLGERARIAWLRGDERELDSIVAQMEALPSETPPLFGARARRLFLEGDSTAAFRELQRAVDASTPNEQPTWLYELADLLRRAGHLDAAAQAYRRIVALNPNWARAHYGLGMTLAAAGEEDEAREELSRFLELWSGADSTLVEVREARSTLEGISGAS